LDKWAEAEVARLGQVTPEPGDDVVPPVGPPAPPNKGKGGQPEPKPDEPKPSKTPLAISAAVGQGGRNKPADVEAVQAKLNSVGNYGLKVDGKIGPKTIGAIKDFQKKNGMSSPDGRIDPKGFTERTLNGEKVAPPQGGGGAAGGGKGKGGPGGSKDHKTPENPKKGPSGKKDDTLIDEAGKIAKGILDGVVGAKKLAEQKLNEALKALDAARKARDEAKRKAAEEIIRRLQEALSTGVNLAKQTGKAVRDFTKQKSNQAQELLNDAAEEAKKHFNSAVGTAESAWNWLKSQDLSSLGKPLTADSGNTDEVGQASSNIEGESQEAEHQSAQE
jgi:lysozyme family protein